jgi:hypothetical protein
MERNETEIFEQNRIAELKSRLDEHERTIKEERRKLWHAESGSQEPVVWETLKVVSTYIAGYVSQVTTEGYKIENPPEVIIHLHKLSIFNVKCIMKWYPSAENEYPKIKQYFELLDYIRLLILDFIQRYRLPESATN